MKAEGLIDNNRALNYMLAGKCEVTIVSGKTGTRLSYKITRKKSTSTNGNDYIYFVNITNKNDSVYAGVMYLDKDTKIFKFSTGDKGKYKKEDTVIRGLMYVVNSLLSGGYDIDVKIYHCGVCGRCGKKLTTPESILTGLGPKCAELSGVPYVKSMRG